MRVTVCQLESGDAVLQQEWTDLREHLEQAGGTDFLLLPEMPFTPWMFTRRAVDAAVWTAAVATHERWLERLPELGARVVAGSMPVIEDGHRLNRGFVWDADNGLRSAHTKTYLPNEEGFWEASWYERGPTVFDAIDTPVARVGFLICTELWFLGHARDYANAGVDLLLCPRVTPASSIEKWVAGGRVAGVVAGAFCLSSNQAGVMGKIALGGTGWITDPEAKVLARTDSVRRFASVDIEIEAARGAKHTYPRSVDASPIPA